MGCNWLQGGRSHSLYFYQHAHILDLLFDSMRIADMDALQGEADIIQHYAHIYVSDICIYCYSENGFGNSGIKLDAIQIVCL